MGSIEQHCVQSESVARETRRTRGEEKVRGAGRWRGGRKWRKVDGRRARQAVDKGGGWKHGSVLEEKGGHGGRRGKTK